MLGPNGFYRSFTGNSTSLHVRVHTAYEEKQGELTGNVQVLFFNPGAEPLTATVEDNSYKTGTTTKTIEPRHEASVVLHLGETHGWYDFTVKVDGSETKARFAGRVETGKSSFTDPLMGGVV